MSESTFRAVVALVLVGALVLAVITIAVLLPRTPQPAPVASLGSSATLTSSPESPPAVTPSGTVAPRPAFSGDVVGVGLIPRGGASGTTLVLRFLESGADAIPNAPGSFRVTLTDDAGNGTTVAFVGTPAVEAPYTLGATARLRAPNALQISIASADTNLVELMSIRGLGIRASSTAAVGPVHAALDDFTGSLVAGATNNALPSPGTVIASP